MNAQVYRAVVYDNAGAIVMARMIGASGAYITQASISSIAFKAFDVDSATPDTAITPPSGALTVSAVVFDTLQAAAADLRLWTADSTGFNFKHVVPATAFPKGQNAPTMQRRGRLEYVFTPVSGEVFAMAFDIDVLNLRSFAN